MSLKTSPSALFTAICLSTSLSSAALAQGTLEEVVVTAQKRETNLQETPISVAAFDAEALSKGNISEIGEIAQRAPGLAMGQFNAGQPQIYIRGIGSNEEGPGGDSSVVVYVDDVYMGRASGASMELFDLERVEVLRGPQGTLFGKNASGGAINIVTKMPSDEFTAKVRAGVGNLSQRSIDAYISGPLSDSVAASFSISDIERDGHIENVVTGNDLSNKNTTAVRGRLRWDINDQANIVFSADYSNDFGNGVGRKPRGLTTTRLADTSPFDQTVGDHYKVAIDEDGKQDRELWGGSVRFNWSNDDVDFLSISSYRNNNWAEDTEIVGAQNIPEALLVLFNDVVEDGDQFSQEFRLSGSTENINHWVIGAFYSNEQTNRVEEFQVRRLPVDYTEVEADVTSYAIFGELNYQLQDNLDLTLGARFSRDEKDIRAIGRGIILVNENFDVTAGDSWSEPTYKAVLSYHVNDSAMIYGSVATGYKSGGYQGQPDSPQIATTAFNPEKALSYEVGVKADLLDDTLRANVSIFHSGFEDYQELLTLDVDGLPVSVTQNAAEVTSKGIEFDLTWIPVENLTLTASGAYIESTYDDYIQDSSVIGNYTRNAPKKSYTLAAAYEVPLGDVSSLEFRADYRHKDEAFQDPQNTAYASIPAYDLIDGSVIYNVDDSLSFTLWGKNLADEEYLVHSFAFGSILTAPSISGMPRTYGLSVTKNF